MNLKNLLLGNITQEELLNYHNATVFYNDFCSDNIRGLVDYYKGYYFIYINKKLSYYKKKKTLLHELAHIEKNQLCQSNKDLYAFHIQEYEDEADRYIKQILEEIKKGSEE